MHSNKFIAYLLGAILIISVGISFADAPATAPPPGGNSVTSSHPRLRSTTAADRIAAAQRAAAKKNANQMQAPHADYLGIPPGMNADYFGTPNWTNSPIIPKFVDTLPGLTSANANDLGQYIPVAKPDKLSYPGSDYYEIGLVEYSEQMHFNLTPTKLRGYVQLNNGTDPATNTNTLAPDPVHYLGPLILSQSNVPVRIKFVNMLPIGPAGNLFLPVDSSVMGAGTGPLAMLNGNMEMYKQNRAVVHLHGGATPWISDGTPHQWIIPAGETSSYPVGDSKQNVPDMPDPGPGASTIYYTNQQSSRLMFYHDHAYGLTRLNVYAGEAAGYLITDTTEEDLINRGVLPNLGGIYRYGVPLIIQDKTFVPDPTTLAATDPTWDSVNWGGQGNLWFPHVYMPNQNPSDPMGVNPMGRWDYGPWFWPPMDPLSLGHPPVASVSGGPLDTPGTPNPSLTPEAFMDTPVVNGTPYPVFNIERKVYRFRILNACNDRMLNLGIYYVDPAFPTEVKMVEACPHAPTDPTWPAYWPTDGRDGGVPDPTTAGPPIIQIGTEAGIIPNPAVIPSTPIGYNYNRRDITVLNVLNHGLFLGPAERADVIVDFTGVPNGSKLILYNDSPAPVPAFDPRLDYYTGDPDQSITGNNTGGAPTTLAGFGPNTRTIMQFVVGNAAADPAFNLTTLQTELPAAFAASQPTPIVPQAVFGPAYGATLPNVYSKIQDTSLTYTPIGGTTPVTTPMGSKAIQELFELNYGRMNATLGVELPFTNFNTQTTIPLGYIDPPTEILNHGADQIWKITHNGVDTHAIHFHLFNVQLINRVGWDGMIKPPEPNEVGWKETVRMNPLEDAIVALHPLEPALPFGIPDSWRLMDVTMPAGSTMGFSPVDPLNQPVTTTNQVINFGHEYVWHCHLLGHEENDMMRPMVMQWLNVIPDAPTNASITSAGVLTWTDPTPAATSLGNPKNEIQFIIMRSTDGVSFGQIGTALANATTFIDTTFLPSTNYFYQVIAQNAAGNSLPSNTAILPVVPDAPANVTAVAGDTQATVSFNTPSFTGSAPITLYTVTAYFTATNQPSGQSNTGAGSSIIVSGLTNGISYYFIVTATNSAGTGPNSLPSNSVIPAQLPGAPTNVNGVASNQQLVITFSAPVIGAPISSYTVTLNPGNITRTGSGTSFTVTPLTNGTTYAVTVKATNSVGTGPASTAVNMKVAVPATPTNLTATNSVQSTNPPTVTLNWTDTSTTESGFIVQRSQVANFATFVSFAVGQNVTSFIDTTVAGNTGYYYRVFSVNGFGNSTPSSNSVAITTVIQLLAAPTNLVSTGKTSTSISLSWTDNTNIETNYRLQWGVLVGGNMVWSYIILPAVPGSGGTGTYTQIGLTPNTKYSYRIQAIGAGNATSPWTTVIAVTTLP